MAERFVLFFPSLLILSGVSVLTSLYLRCVVRWLEKKDFQLRKREYKYRFFVVAPNTLLFSSTWEEVMFRAPLIIIFPILSREAWLGIVLSAAMFSSLHWLLRETNLLGSIRKKNAVDTNKLLGGDIEKNKGLKKVVGILAPFALGSLSGCLGVRYQSLYVSSLTHMAWNLLMPVIISATGLLVILTITLFQKIQDIVRGQPPR